MIFDLFDWRLSCLTCSYESKWMSWTCRSVKNLKFDIKYDSEKQNDDRDELLMRLIYLFWKQFWLRYFVVISDLFDWRLSYLTCFYTSRWINWTCRFVKNLKFDIRYDLKKQNDDRDELFMKFVYLFWEQFWLYNDSLSWHWFHRRSKHVIQIDRIDWIKHDYRYSSFRCFDLIELRISCLSYVWSCFAIILTMIDVERIDVIQ